MSVGVMEIAYKLCDCDVYCVVIVSVKDLFTHV